MGSTLEGFLEETLPPYFPCSFQVKHFIFPKENKGNPGLLHVSVIPYVTKVYQHFGTSVS